MTCSTTPPAPSAVAPAAPLESKLETALYDGVRRIGGLCEKIAPTRWGMPDRLVLLPGGRVYLVELKTDTGEVRPAQKVWHDKAASRGTLVVIIRGLAELQDWLAQQDVL